MRWSLLCLVIRLCVLVCFELACVCESMDTDCLLLARALEQKRKLLALLRLNVRALSLLQAQLRLHEARVPRARQVPQLLLQAAQRWDYERQLQLELLPKRAIRPA